MRFEKLGNFGCRFLAGFARLSMGFEKLGTFGDDF